MAYLTLHTCPLCGNKGQRTKDICNKCSTRIEKADKEKWLNEFKANKTLEERVSQIEEWIHDNKDDISSYHSTDRLA